MKRLLAGGAVVAALTMAPVSAEPVTVQTGTWFVGALTGLPAPPTLPTGGLWISGTPLGPYAMSAVRFTLPPDRANPTLTLKIARLTSTPSTPLGTGQNPIVACLATSSWKPTGNAPGSWSSAPTYDCTKGEISGVTSLDGSTMSFELGSLAHPGDALSMVLVPGTISNPIPATVPVPIPMLPALPALPLGLSVPNPTGGQLNATFDATFQAVTAGAITTTAATPIASPSRTAVVEQPSASPAPVFEAPAPVVSGPTVATPAAAPAPPPEAPAAPPLLAVAAPVRHATSKDDAGHRVLAALLLGLFVGWAVRSVGSFSGRRLTLYDVPPPDAARPASTLTRIRRA